MLRFLNYKIIPFYKAGIFVLAFAIVIASCSNPYKNITKIESSNIEKTDIPYSIKNGDKPSIFKADIKFYKNDISGLLVIKETAPEVYRIALATQFGLNIFDFELDHGVLNVKYCIEYMNRKLILKTFETDFNLLLMQMKYSEFKNYKNSDGKQIWHFKDKKLNYYYVESTDTNTIKNISFRKRNSEKIAVTLQDYRDILPKEIVLDHKNIKLNMTLKLIN